GEPVGPTQLGKGNRARELVAVPLSEGEQGLGREFLLYACSVYPKGVAVNPRMHQAESHIPRVDWTELQISAHHLGEQTWRSDAIPRDALPLSFGEDGCRLYGGDTGYYRCGGDASYTDSSVGAVDNPPGATAD
ncbi:MAG: hypothetical protein D6798_07225, partial [Deltaproteobacteria bacterium]